ncbi:DUF3352 domain-containing protein [Mesorhizobium sp. ES1-3]|uniref:DUF3352 domain-containing protein n=1 Tax=Mesorhizobium sp. ES1-3 TaxID=2876628 RepID=UPI001CCD4E13|nr:DUF3352 domain-containing protein [Mesorhizobium sp. ES1-3]MBZ9673971.1 DUF3352 domain-containing protein [Mesorhizobium sp. ES1-3]
MSVSGNGENATSSLPTDVRKEIRREAIQQVAKYTVAGVVALIALAGAGWFLYLKDNAPKWVNGVPAGAIMAFDLSDTCPDGWAPFNDVSGRFIVGSGKGTDLTEHVFRNIGGREEQSLTVDQLPPQQITIPSPVYSKTDHYDVPGGPVTAVGIYQNMVSFGGTSKSVPILPPYLPLKYCKKT